MAGALAVLVGSLRRVEVVGPSMAPSLVAGDRLVVVRRRPGWIPHPGDLVALPDPRDRGRPLVKRVAGVGPQGVDVRGDNAAQSTDSREFGPVPAGTLTGRPVYRYWPPERAGWLR